MECGQARNPPSPSTTIYNLILRRSGSHRSISRECQSEGLLRLLTGRSTSPPPTHPSSPIYNSILNPLSGFRVGASGAVPRRCHTIREMGKVFPAHRSGFPCASAGPIVLFVWDLQCLAVGTVHQAEVGFTRADLPIAPRRGGGAAPSWHRSWHHPHQLRSITHQAGSGGGATPDGNFLIWALRTRRGGPGNRR